MDNVADPMTTTDSTLKSALPMCPKCQGVMKRSNFRTGSVDKPKVNVSVCTKCGFRIEIESK